MAYVRFVLVVIRKVISIKPHHSLVGPQDLVKRYVPSFYLGKIQSQSDSRTMAVLFAGRMFLVVNSYFLSSDRAASPQCICSSTRKSSLSSE
jgi:hypothetical protein